jgi:hypothetical protein
MSMGRKSEMNEKVNGKQTFTMRWDGSCRLGYHVLQAVILLPYSLALSHGHNIPDENTEAVRDCTPVSVVLVHAALAVLNPWQYPGKVIRLHVK